jgi:hypothetical protein
MPNITIEKSLYDEIAAFCELNSITDVNGFINKTLNKGFDMEKYGESFALLFNKSSEDIIHIKPKKEEPKVIEPLVIEPEVTVKKRGRKKKEEPKVEEITTEVILPEVEKEPIYKIKEEEIKKVEKKYVTLKNKRDDNYDVYDEI